MCVCVCVCVGGGGGGVSVLYSMDISIDESDNKDQSINQSINKHRLNANSCLNQEQKYSQIDTDHIILVERALSHCSGYLIRNNTFVTHLHVYL